MNTRGGLGGSAWGEDAYKVNGSEECGEDYNVGSHPPSCQCRLERDATRVPEGGKTVGHEEASAGNLR